MDVTRGYLGLVQVVISQRPLCAGVLLTRQFPGFLVTHWVLQNISQVTPQTGRFFHRQLLANRLLSLQTREFQVKKVFFLVKRQSITSWWVLQTKSKGNRARKLQCLQ